MHWKQIQTALKAFLNRRITWWIPHATQIEFFEIQHIRCDIDSHLSLSGLLMVNGVYPVDLEIAIIVIRRKWVLTEFDVCKKCNQNNVENRIHTHILWGYSLIGDGTNTLSLWYYYGSYFGEYSEIWIERPWTIEKIQAELTFILIVETPDPQFIFDSWTSSILSFTYHSDV